MKQLILFLLGTFLVAGVLIAQPRTNYPMLHRLNQSPVSFLDQLYFPSSGNQTLTIFTFKLGYDQLTFRRVNTQTGDVYTSEVEFMIDIYDKSTPAVPDRAFLERRTWRKTVQVDTYELTQSKIDFIEGALDVEIPPDTYRYIATISVNGQSRRFSPVISQAEMIRPVTQPSRRNTDRDRNQRLLIQVPDFTTEAGATITFLNRAIADQMEILNLGQNVVYAQDYDVLIGVPSVGSSPVTVVITNVGLRPTSQNDDGKIDSASEVFRIELNDETLINLPAQVKLADGSIIHDLAGSRFIYHRIQIPNNALPNAWYDVHIVNNDNSTHAIQTKRVLSRWFDIPSSLLNLDVAIENLKFIVDDNQLKEIRRGNAVEKERKFRAFWDSRDPTPGTDYNELMAEYYFRIDYAFENFTTPSKLGHESDQGRIFITYGPPDSINRIFPPSGLTQEVWQYGDRTFIFQATSGFGDFQLVTQ
jgi:GWxTD domain-containing protein